MCLKLFSVPRHSAEKTLRLLALIHIITSALVGLRIFHYLMGVLQNPASISAPEGHSEKWEKAFESSSKIVTKVIR